MRHTPHKQRGRMRKLRQNPVKGPKDLAQVDALGLRSLCHREEAGVDIDVHLLLGRSAGPTANEVLPGNIGSGQRLR